MTLVEWARVSPKNLCRATDVVGELYITTNFGDISYPFSLMHHHQKALRRMFDLRLAHLEDASTAMRRRYKTGDGVALSDIDAYSFGVADYGRFRAMDLRMSIKFCEVYGHATPNGNILYGQLMMSAPYKSIELLLEDPFLWS